MSTLSTPPKSFSTSQGGLQGPDGEQGRLFAVLAYLLPVLGAFIGLAADGKNSLTRFHAQQSIAAALALLMSFLAWAALGYVVALIPIAGPILAIALFSLVIAMAFFLAVNWVLSLLSALRGEDRTIPLANRIVRRLFGETPAAKPSV